MGSGSGVGVWGLEKLGFVEGPVYARVRGGTYLISLLRAKKRRETEDRTHTPDVTGTHRKTE